MYVGSAYIRASTKLFMKANYMSSGFARDMDSSSFQAPACTAGTPKMLLQL